MTREHHVLVRILAALGALMMLCVLGGWALGVDLLVRPAPQLASTVPSTALCLAMLYLCLPMLGMTAPLSARLARTLACATIALALVNLSLSLIGGTDIDHLVFEHVLAPSDRMSHGTAIGLIFAAATVLATLRLAATLVPGLMAVVGLSSFVAIVAGNSFEPESAFAIPLLDGMSVYTAGALAVLFFALLLSIDARNAAQSQAEYD